MAQERISASDRPHLSAWAGFTASGLALVATLWFLVWPCSYRSISTGGGSVQQTCVSLLGENGTDYLFVLLIPSTLAVLGMLPARADKRLLALALGIVDLAFCLVTSASIGLWYLPSAIFLVMSAATIQIDRR
jgi:hypothetical protein